MDRCDYETSKRIDGCVLGEGATSDVIFAELPGAYWLDDSGWYC